MYNRSELSKAIKQAKASKSKKKPVDVDVDLKGKGYKDPKNSNKPALKLYTDSIYNPTDKDLMLYPDNGLPVFKPAGDVSTTFFPGANNVTERVVAQRGGYVSKQNGGGLTQAQTGQTTRNSISPIQLTDNLDPFGSMFYNPLDNKGFIANQPYTYAARPGSYYKMVNNQMQIKNKDTNWKYVEMKDPTGTRLKTLQAGLESGNTKAYVKPTTTINDFYYSKEELKKQQLNDRAQECLSGADGNCLGSAFLYYDKYVAPNLGLKTSWELKEEAGLTSGKKGNPNYNNWGESVDSWELRGAFGDKAKQYYAAPLNNQDELYKKLQGMTAAEKDKYFRDMNLPIGTIIQGGFKGYDEGKAEGSSYNEKKGFAPSHHSGIVVGYDDFGTPIIYDYGNVRKITDPANLLMSPNYAINNIYAPNQNVQQTYEYLKKSNKLRQEVTPLKIKIPNIESISDIDEMQPFLDQIEKNKGSVMDVFNLTNAEYNELAKIAAATALTETKGGKDLGTWRGPAPAYLLDKVDTYRPFLDMTIPGFKLIPEFGQSKGITQINPDSVWNKKDGNWRNPALVNKLEQLGITRDTYNPWNPKHQAIVTLGLTDSNLKTAKANASKNPNVSKNLTDVELAYYQWNIPSALTTDDYDKAARGDNQNVKREVEYYNMIDTSNKKLGGNIDPGNNALELHMFYDKDVFQDGGQYLDLTDQEIEEYRKGGYVVEEPVKPKPYEKYKDFRKRNIIDLTLNPGEAAKKYMSVNPELFDAYMYYKNLGYKPSTGSETCSARYCKYDEDAWKQFNKTSTTDRFAPVRSTPVVSKSKTDSKNTATVSSAKNKNIPATLPISAEPAVKTPVDEIYSLPIRSAQTINTERSLPEIPTNEETLLKRWSPEQNKWILNEVSATDPAVKLYQEKVDWAKKNPQRRESSLFISAEEQAEYENKKKRELDMLQNFLGNKTNESLTKAQKGGQYYTYSDSKGVYRKVGDKWEVDWNRSGNFQPLSKGNVKQREAALNKGAKQFFDQDYSALVDNRNQAFESAPAKPVAKKLTPEQRVAQKQFDQSFQVTDKSNYEQIENEAKKVIDQSKAFAKEKGLEFTKADEDRVVRDMFAYSGVYDPIRGSIERPVIDMPSDSSVSFEAPKSPTVGDYAGRAWDIIRNPIDAFNYSVKTGDVSNMPWNYSAYEDAKSSTGYRDFTDDNTVGSALNVASYFHPAGAIMHGIADMVELPGRAYKNIQEGNWGDLAADVAFTGLEFIPGLGLIDDIAQGARRLELNRLRNIPIPNREPRVPGYITNNEQYQQYQDYLASSANQLATPPSELFIPTQTSARTAQNIPTIGSPEAISALRNQNVIPPPPSINEEFMNNIVGSYPNIFNNILGANDVHTYNNIGDIYTFTQISPDRISRINSREDAEDLLERWGRSENINIRNISDDHLLNVATRTAEGLGMSSAQITSLPEYINTLPENDLTKFLRRFTETLPNSFSPQQVNELRSFNSPGIARNRSDMPKDVILSRVGEKQREKISKMTDDEFQNSVLRPDGEIDKYVPPLEIDKLQYSPEYNKMTLEDVTLMPVEEYANEFNANIDKINEIIRKHNKSGVDYEVVELTPGGRLIFKTPERTVQKELSNTDKLLIERAEIGLKDVQSEYDYMLENNLFKNQNEADLFKQGIEQHKNYTENLKNRLSIEVIPEGTKSWSVKINSGKWSGEVEDIANQDYLEAIPGLGMSNTMGSVFADGIPRRGTGTYEALNEALKSLNIGRVKAGFNSQTGFSRGLWENAVKKKKATGYYGNSNVVYGVMYPNGGNTQNLPYNKIGNYQQGGSVGMEMDLTDEEIKKYRDAGYVIIE
jgi:hypothetical protein